jgi:hypothetical protein
MELNPPPNNFRFHGVNYDERPLDDLIVFFALSWVWFGGTDTGMFHRSQNVRSHRLIGIEPGQRWLQHRNDRGIIDKCG